MNEPQSYLKIKYSWNHPNLDYFYLVIQVRSSGMNEIFGLAWTFVTWDGKQTSVQKPFQLNKGAENFKIILFFFNFFSAHLCNKSGFSQK